MSLRELDPTNNGKYMKWVTSRYDEKWRPLLAGMLKQYISLSDRGLLIAEHTDINRFKSCQDLAKVIQSYEPTEGVKLIVRNEILTVYTVLNEQTMIKLGKGSSWCTSRPKESDYDRYTIEGKVPLYFISLVDGRKMLLSYTFAEFSNWNNVSVKVDEITGIEEWFIEIFTGTLASPFKYIIDTAFEQEHGAIPGSHGDEDLVTLLEHLFGHDYPKEGLGDDTYSKLVALTKDVELLCRTVDFKYIKQRLYEPTKEEACLLVKYGRATKEEFLGQIPITFFLPNLTQEIVDASSTVEDLLNARDAGWKNFTSWELLTKNTEDKEWYSTLEELGADLNLKSKHGIPVLFYLAQNNSPLLLEFISRSSVNVQARDNEDNTVLFFINREDLFPEIDPEHKNINGLNAAKYRSGIFF